MVANTLVLFPDFWTVSAVIVQEAFFQNAGLLLEQDFNVHQEHINFWGHIQPERYDLAQVP